MGYNTRILKLRLTFDLIPIKQISVTEMVFRNRDYLGGRKYSLFPFSISIFQLKDEEEGYQVSSCRQSFGGNLSKSWPCVILRVTASSSHKQARIP